MRTILSVLLLCAGAFAQIPSITLPHVFSADSIPKVRYVYENDTILANRIRQITDTVNADSVKTLIKSLGNLRLTIDNDNNGTGHKFAITNNGATDTIFKAADDLSAKFFGGLTIAGTQTGAAANFSGAVSTGALSSTTGSFSSTLGVTGTLTGGAANFSGAVSTGALSATSGTYSGTISAANYYTLGKLYLDGGFGAYLDATATGGHSGQSVRIYADNAALSATFSPTGVSIPGTLGVTGKLTVSDTVVAETAIRIGNVAGSNPILNRSGAKMLNTPDSLTVGGKIYATNAPRFSSVTASQILAVDANKDLTSIATTGTGSVVKAASPTISGTLTASGSVSVTGGDILVQRSINGDLATSIWNTSNQSSAQAILSLLVGDTTSGDAYVRFNVNGANEWLAGIDNSDDDAFAISLNGSLGVNNKFKIARSGLVSVPGTLGVTGKLTGTDTIAAETALRFGNVAGSSPILYRSGAKMLRTPDSLTVGGKLYTQDITLSGSFSLGGSFTDKTTSVSSNTTLGTSYSTVFASATGGGITLTLPAASGNTGLTYTIFKTDASENTVIVDGNASETIGGSTTVTLCGNASNSRLVIVCDGTNWQIKELYEEGTFTLTATGLTTSPTGTAFYTINGNDVTLHIPTITGTSNSNQFTLTGVPAALRPAGATIIYLPVVGMQDNGSIIGTESGLLAAIDNSTAIQFSKNNTSTGWTSSGAKGVLRHIIFPYTRK